MTAKYILIPVLLLALSVTYAGFSDTLFIGTANVPNTVTTTDMEWVLAKDAYSGDYILSCYGKQITDPNNFDPFNQDGMADDQYAAIDCSNVEENNPGSTTIHVTVSNAYPGYAFGIDFRAVNIGDLPSKLRDVQIDAPQSLKDSALVAYKLVYNLKDGSGNHYSQAKDLTFDQFEQAIENELSGKIFYKYGYIDFGDESDNDHTIWIYFPPDGNPAPPQGETLKFNITFVFGQFNE